MSPYITNGLMDRQQIWHSDALTKRAVSAVKIFKKIQDGGQSPS